jgi:hypothetical protein
MRNEILKTATSTHRSLGKPTTATYESFTFQEGEDKLGLSIPKVQGKYGEPVHLPPIVSTLNTPLRLAMSSNAE